MFCNVYLRSDWVVGFEEGINHSTFCKIVKGCFSLKDFKSPLPLLDNRMLYEYISYAEWVRMIM